VEGRDVTTRADGWRAEVWAGSERVGVAEGAEVVEVFAGGMVLQFDPIEPAATAPVMRARITTDAGVEGQWAEFEPEPGRPIVVVQRVEYVPEA
jgi:hypothetical protein